MYKYQNSVLTRNAVHPKPYEMHESKVPSVTSDEALVLVLFIIREEMIVKIHHTCRSNT